MVYCPRGINDESYNFLTNIFQTLSNNNKDCVIMGDFNCNTINKYEPSAHDFLSLTIFNSFHPYHYLPTRVNEKSASALDVIFTNITNMSCLPGITIDDISDHFQSLPSLINLPLTKLQKHCVKTYTKGTLVCVTFRNFSFYFTVNIGKILTIIIHLICLMIILLSASLKTLAYVFQKIRFRPSTNGKKWITPAIKQACLAKISYVKDT